jgi:hypothetical protein
MEVRPQIHAQLVLTSREDLHVPVRSYEIMSYEN